MLITTFVLENQIFKPKKTLTFVYKYKKRDQRLKRKFNLLSFCLTLHLPISSSLVVIKVNV